MLVILPEATLDHPYPMQFIARVLWINVPDLENVIVIELV